MIAILTIVRYPRWFGWAGFISMALFRFPLWMNRKISFWKLLGSGKNGTFDIKPDWRQWALLIVSKEQTFQPGKFIEAWWHFFKCEKLTFVLEPIEGHGTWDGKMCFGNLPKQTAYDGMIAVLTRATIKLSRLNHFWKNVNTVATKMNTAEGFVTSFGIGEVPWIKQATFSIWQTKEHMRTFAYQMQEHKEVIRKTKQEQWYSEDMFVRFKILAVTGSLNGQGSVLPEHKKTLL